MPILDVATLSFMSMVMFTVTGLFLAILWLTHRDIPGPNYWAAGYLSGAIGVLTLIFRGVFPDAVVIVLGNAAVMAAFVLSWWGTDRFYGRRPAYRIGLGFLIAASLVMFYLTAIQPYFTLRVVVVSLMVAGFAVATAYATLKGREQVNRLPQIIVAISFILVAAFYLLRLYRAYATPDMLAPVANNWINMATFWLPTAMGSLAAFAWVLMVNDRMRAQLAQTARLDSLTGTLNRIALDDLADKEVSRCVRHRSRVAALMIDIDNFKAVNDLYGHAVGDEVLREVALSALGILRREDHLARYGGDEFCVILPETSAEGAVQLAERIRDAVRQAEIRLPNASSGAIGVKISIGVAELGEQGFSWHLLAQRAADALAQAKSEGRDRVARM